MTKRIKSKIWEDQVLYQDGFSELADLITDVENPIKVENFDDFVQRIFSKSYPNYDFNTWHVRKLSHEVDLVLGLENKYLLAVLPRYHLKSTILCYAAHIFRMLTAYGDGMLVSYKDELCNFHSSNIKSAIRDNEELAKVFHDEASRSDAIIKYKIGSRICRIFSSGVLSVKRGIHVDLLLTADDVLGDLQNPMVFTELDKVKRIFESEIVNIPNKDCPLFVFGTVIALNDLLYSLRDNPNFRSIWLPALYPDAEHDVLWEKKYDRKWLENRKVTSGWKAFSTEFLLTPMMSMEAFLTKEALDTVIDKSLTNYQVPGW